MIYSIKGTVKKVSSSKVVVETPAGLSFEIAISPRLVGKLRLGESCEVLVAFVSTEKFFGFYGFEDEQQREVFYKLEAVSGIGHKLAYNIVSFSKVKELQKKAQAGDVEFFTQIPGVGKKTARKLIVELSQIFEEEVSFSKLFLDKEDQLLLEILKSLGFKMTEIRKILPKVDKSKPVEERVKVALKYLSES